MKKNISIKALFLSLLLFPAYSFAQNAEYDIYALEYIKGGVSAASEIAEGASSKDSVKECYEIWLLKGNNKRLVLVDAGYTDTAKYKVKDFTRPDLVLKKVNVDPRDITDIIISHTHYDHIGGIDLFPNAMIWMQEDDFRYFVYTAWQKDGFSLGLDKEDVKKLMQKSMDGHLTLVKGDSLEIIPGIRVFIGSKHTWESQYVLVNGSSGKTIIASDNIWFYYNLDHLISIPLTFDKKAYVNQMKRMKTLVSDTELIIPGHDALTFTRFPTVAEGVVKIERTKK